MGKKKSNEESFEFENPGAVRIPWPVDGPADTWKSLVARTLWGRFDNGYWTTGHIFVAKRPESARGLKITSDKVHRFGKVDQVVADAFGPAARATPVAVMRSGPHVLHENSNAIVFSTPDGSEYYVPENQARLLMAEYPSAEWFVAEFEGSTPNPGAGAPGFSHGEEAPAFLLSIFIRGVYSASCSALMSSTNPTGTWSIPVSTMLFGALNIAAMF